MFSSISSSSSAASPLQHDGVAQDLGDAPRAGRVALDELDLVAVLDALREPQADVAAARDHDALHRVLDAAQLAHDLAHVLGGGDEEHLVVVLDHRVALGRDAAAVAVDRDDARVDVRQVLAQGAQLLADQRAAADRLDPDQPHAAVGEVEHLQRARVADQPLDVLGDQLLGADVDVHREASAVRRRSVRRTAPRGPCTRASGCARSWSACGTASRRSGRRPCSLRRCWSARRACRRSAAPACSSTFGWAALPATVRMSRRSCRSRSSSSLVSTTVTSLASSRARWYAAVRPTWPAPRMMIFTFVAP